MVGGTAATSSLKFCFKSTVVLGFSSYTLLSEEEVLRLGTLVPVNIEVPTKYSLSQNRIVVFENRLHSKSPMLYRPALHGNWNALSIARRALKDKFSKPTVPLSCVAKSSGISATPYIMTNNMVFWLNVCVCYAVTTLFPMKYAAFKYLHNRMYHLKARKWETKAYKSLTGRSPVEIVGSNPTGGMDICLLW
jgi:hypothetical protein